MILGKFKIKLMKKLLVLVFALFSNGYSFSQINTIAIEGTYALVHFYEQHEVVTTMHITPLHENKFEVSGDGWVGEGEILGDSGYYIWEFQDGRKGRTNFIINQNGQIIGHVLGAMPNPEIYGLNWTYLALPQKSNKFII
jgi:hypothetical protein